ncbi:SHOCT-like domain-containing protein [Oceanithermus sp.]
MDEYTRIAELLESGKITAEEAQRLIEAREEEPPPPPPPGCEIGAVELAVRLRRAELSLAVREEASEPRLEGEVEGVTLERAEGGWRLYDRSDGLDLGGLLGFLRGALLRRVVLTVPAGTRVQLDLGQGTLRSKGRLAALEGELGQGTARIEEAMRVRFEVGQGTLIVGRAEALDLEVGQGTIEASARIAEGRHRVEAGMGSVRIDLLEGSDVRVRLTSGLGSVRLVQDGEVRKGKGQHSGLEATLGSGRARLEVESGLGTVEVRLP